MYVKFFTAGKCLIKTTNSIDTFCEWLLRSEHDAEVKNWLQRMIAKHREGRNRK